MSGGALVVIPARLGSTRLPGKPLLRADGKFLIQLVYERALLLRRAAEVIVATDHESILEAVQSFGGRAVMTAASHASGSDRVAEVARGHDLPIVLNLQGDEPEFPVEDADALVEAMEKEDEAPLGTLVFPALTAEEQQTPSVVKAIVEGRYAVDFRREPTPGAGRHIGIYAFRAAFLQEFTRLPPSAREKERKLEQMRALDHGRKIRAVAARRASAGIDTPEDFHAFLRRRGGSLE